jgi:hypothetical protein
MAIISLTETPRKPNNSREKLNRSVFSFRRAAAYNLTSQILSGFANLSLSCRIMEKELTDRAERIRKRILQLRDSL